MNAGLKCLFVFWGALAVAVSASPAMADDGDEQVDPGMPFIETPAPITWEGSDQDNEQVEPVKPIDNDRPFIETPAPTLWDELDQLIEPAKPHFVVQAHQGTAVLQGTVVLQGTAVLQGTGQAYEFALPLILINRMDGIVL